MKVLSQSYDWLLFLTDEGLTTFIQDIISSDTSFPAVKNAFEMSYVREKKTNRFTKTKMDSEADLALAKYFVDNIRKIESWFNVITPYDSNLKVLNAMLTRLNVLGV